MKSRSSHTLQCNLGPAFPVFTSVARREDPRGFCNPHIPYIRADWKLFFSIFEQNYFSKNVSTFLTKKKKGKKRSNCCRPSGLNFGHPLDSKQTFFKGGLRICIYSTRGIVFDRYFDEQITHLNKLHPLSFAVMKRFSSEETDYILLSFRLKRAEYSVEMELMSTVTSSSAWPKRRWAELFGLLVSMRTFC